jgi:hypothetical protein
VTRFTADYAMAWFRAFLFTEAVEVPIYRFVAGAPTWAAFAASAITHPFVWYFFPPVGEALGLSYLQISVVSELFAWWVEAAFFVFAAKMPVRRALFFSFVANGASVVVGLLSRKYLGYP